MTTVAQAFQELIESMELTEKQAETASAQQTRVREALKQDLRGDLADTFLGGSYKRRTAVRPLGDIDFFVVLADARYLSRPIADCMELLETALRGAFPRSALRRQNRSVHIDFSGTGIGYDVVPAIKLRDDVYQIPDVRRRGWIRTAPRRHEEISIEKNRVAGGMLKPLIKLCKLWNTEQDKLIASFHLEVLAYSAFNGKPSDYPFGLALLFQHIARKLHSPAADPAGVGPAIDEDLTPQERQRAIDRFDKAAQHAERAYRSQTHEGWRSFFAPHYRA